jgi:transposase
MGKAPLIRDLSSFTQAEKRAAAVAMRATGVKSATVARKLRMHRNTVSAAVKRWNATGSNTDLPRSGRPTVITAKRRAWIKQKLLDPKVGSVKRVAAMLKAREGVGTRTTVRKARKQAGLLIRSLQRKPALTPANRARRLDYARSHKDDPPQFVRAVVYSDEKHFTFNARKRIVYVQPGDPPPYSARRRYETSVSVWGCISWWGKSQLTLYTPARYMDATEYVKVLKSRLVPDMRALFKHRKYVLQQDGCSAHTGQEVSDFLEKRGIDYIKDWPAHSPDLNLIENVWGIIVNRMAGRDIETVDELRAAILHEWDSISFDDIRHLYDSVPHRMQEVIARDGHPINY